LSFVLISAVISVVGFAGSRAVVGAVTGAGIGLGQWLFLRQRLPHAGWWLLVTTVGFAVGWTIGGAVGMAVGRSGIDWTIGWVIGFAVTGAVAGLGQWLLLRRGLAQAGWWIVATTVGWTVGESIGLALRGS
jgi:hypothetical protein